MHNIVAALSPPAKCGILLLIAINITLPWTTGVFGPRDRKNQGFDSTANWRNTITLMFPATIRRLEVFLTVVDAGSMHGAAEVLSISQPSVSDHIHALEVQLGQRLFERRRGAAVSLTEGGRRLYQAGSELILQINSMTESLGLGRKSSRRRRMVIAAQRSIANFLLCDPIADFARRKVDVEIFIKAGSYENVVKDLLEAKADIGFLLADGPVLDLASEMVGQERLGFFAGPTPPLARREQVDISELIKCPFVGADRASRFSQMVDGLLARNGIRGLQVICQTQEASITRAMVSRNVGIACAMACTMTDAVRRGEIVELHVACPTMHVEIHQCYASGRRPSGLAVEFAKTLISTKTFHKLPES